VLLQVLDDGRLTDGQGRTADFKNTLIIMTSNLGAECIVNDGSLEEVLSIVRLRFRPEFLNRIDEILIFQRLSREQMYAIVDIQISRLQKLLTDRKIIIKIDDSARTWLASRGYDPTYGARPLKRVIQRNVQDILAELLLEGKIKDGDIVTVSATGARGIVINGHEVGNNEMIEDLRVVH
jgi:ATP-dependent Clp protease ATP-binding subunit ClpB